jgi:hypothetical protein
MIQETKLLFTEIVVPVTDGPGTQGRATVSKMGFLQYQRVQPPGGIPGTQV